MTKKSKKSKAATKKGFPVSGFPMRFEWQTDLWEALFDEQTKLIQNDLLRARAENQTVVYLSCPISSRGGGDHGTNVDIAMHTANRLSLEWGPGFFILNPASYQMESRGGTGLMRRHARNIGRLDELDGASPPRGGDYMRMWTRVLVLDDYLDDYLPRARTNLNLGGAFDTYYFLSPSDVRHYFTRGGAETVTAGVEEYFARKFATDFEFRSRYESTDPVEFSRARSAFFRFYGARASATFSKGCHDEWNILVRLNELRLAHSAYGLGEQIGAYFERRQVGMSTPEFEVARGYEV